MQKVPREELNNLAREVLAACKPKSAAIILALSGDLGAGKTTFVQALARELGVRETLQSPTYVLMKKYKTTHPRFTRLVHIDAYRLETAEEFAALRPEEFLQDAQNLVCIEWPERVEGALPAPDVVLRFSSENAGEGERFIKMEK